LKILAFLPDKAEPEDPLLLQDHLNAQADVFLKYTPPHKALKAPVNGKAIILDYAAIFV
jgi:hypothetical protein